MNGKGRIKRTPAALLRQACQHLDKALRGPCNMLERAFRKRTGCGGWVHCRIFWLPSNPMPTTFSQISHWNISSSLFPSVTSSYSQPELRNNRIPSAEDGNNHFVRSWASADTCESVGFVPGPTRAPRELLPGI
jgi:hypothetical protein